MQEVDPGALAHHVLWAAFALSLLFGAIAQRTQFCTMGAVADVALGSFLALAAIVGGALLALHYQGWRVERSMA